MNSIRKHGLILRGLAVMLLIGMTAGLTAAYLTDLIGERAGQVQSGILRLRYPDAEHGIKADFSQPDERTLPYQTGDSVVLWFSAYLSGNASALLVPEFTVKTIGGSEQDVIEVAALHPQGGYAEKSDAKSKTAGEKENRLDGGTDSERNSGTNGRTEDGRSSTTHGGTNSGLSSESNGGVELADGARVIGTLSGNGSGSLYDSIGQIGANAERHFAYRITAKDLKELRPLRMQFDFRIAGVQERHNDALLTVKPEQAFQSIIARQEGSAEEEPVVQAVGFTDICSLKRAIDQNGETFDSAIRKQYLAELIPQFEAGNPENGTLTWYMIKNGKETMLQESTVWSDNRTDGFESSREAAKSGAQDSAGELSQGGKHTRESGTESTADAHTLRLLVQGKQLDQSYRYELKNRAGIQPSPVYSFSLEDGVLRVKTQGYDADLSERE